MPQVVEAMGMDIVRLEKIASRFSKIGSIPTLTKINPNEVINQIVDYYKIRLPQLTKSCHIEKKLQDVPEVLGNQDLLEWVLENLIKNSVQAILEKATIKEFKGKIIITSSYINGSVFISVEDNGKGISVSQQKQIFKPGFTTKKRGWGLGLALAKRIIEEYHHGVIRISESEVGKGSKFEIAIPVK